MKGEILELKNTINTMVDQLNAFASRSDPRGARGRHRGQARRPGARCAGVAGTWKDLTDNVNSMASQPHRPGAQHRRGRPPPSPTATCPRRSPSTSAARSCELKNTINTMVDQLDSFASRSDARGARSRHRRQARRPGRGARRGRHLEGPHRQRQLRWPSTSPPRSATSPR